MANDIVALCKEGPVATVTLQRPPANAISIEPTERIGGVFESVADDPSIRAVILSGQGTSFCAGLDLKIAPFLGTVEQKRLLNALNRALYALYGCLVPVVGAINGYALQVDSSWRWPAIGASGLTGRSSSARPRFWWAFAIRSRRSRSLVRSGPRAS
jgi:hypothetical protein